MVLSDAQKSKLKKHMDAYKGTATDKKSHKGKMMRRMEKGMSVKKAMDDIGKSDFASKNRGKKNAKNPINQGLLFEAVNRYNQGVAPNQEVLVRQEGDAGAGLVQIRLPNGQPENRYLIMEGGVAVTPPMRQAILNIARDLAEEMNAPLPPLPPPPPKKRKPN
jgi:hypothetical protein